MKRAEQIERVREVFDGWAVEGRADGLESSHGPSARPAFEKLSLAPDSWYLDIGCGSGYTVRWAAAACQGGRAVGLDLSSGMVRLATRLSASSPTAEFLCSEFPDASLPAGQFDAIFSMETFYYIADLPRALARVHELLKPGGQFACVVDFYAENTASHGWPLELETEFRLLSALGWKNTFLAAGFELQEQSRIKRSEESGVPTWKIRQGSLLTLGRKPL